MSKLSSVVSVTLIALVMGVTPASSSPLSTPVINDLGYKHGSELILVPPVLTTTSIMVDTEVNVADFFTAATVIAVAPEPVEEKGMVALMHEVEEPEVEEVVPVTNPKSARTTDATLNSSQNTNSGKSASVAPGPVVPASESQEIAYGQVMSNGWTEEDFSCLVSLWNKESRWNSQAANPTSSARGIPQALMSTHFGSNWQDPSNEKAQEYLNNPGVQIAWGLKYIKGRYGAPCSAWSHSQAKGWY